MTTNPPVNDGESPVHRLDEFVAIPRVAGLALSADGSRLVTSVSTLDAGITLSSSSTPTARCSNDDTK